MQVTNVIVETPKGSIQKFNYDPSTGYFKLKKVMPAGVVFPFDFGFLPGTIGEDGDPLDAIIISEIQTFPGCALDCRVIGVIKAVQRERDGKKMRNDRFIAIPAVSEQYADVNNLKDFSKQTLRELEVFFANYNNQAGKNFKVIGHANASGASKLIHEGRSKAVKPTKIIQLFLPIRDPKGKPFAPKQINAVKSTLIEKFNGLTTYVNSKLVGDWKKAEKQKVQDELMVYEVLSGDIDVAYWENYKKILEKQFKQETILIRCIDVSVI